MESVEDKKIVTSLIIACTQSLQEKIEKKFAPKAVFKNNVEDEICCCACASPMLTDIPRTFIMRWNPEISNHKVVDFEESMECFFDHGFYYDWSIWDYNKVHIGDKFYMLKVGNGNTGIVMQGTIISKPYKDEDWSGKGRDVRYVRMDPECMIHPDNKSLLITTEELDMAIPDIDWNHGHSGVRLTDKQAILLDSIWESRVTNIN